MKLNVEQDSFLHSLLQAVLSFVIFHSLITVFEESQKYQMIFLSYVIFDIFIILLLPGFYRKFYKTPYQQILTRNFMIVLLCLFNVVATISVLVLHEGLSLFLNDSNSLWITAFLITGWFGQELHEPNNKDTIYY